MIVILQNIQQVEEYIQQVEELNSGIKLRNKILGFRVDFEKDGEIRFPSLGN